MTHEEQDFISFVLQTLHSYQSPSMGAVTVDVEVRLSSWMFGFCCCFWSLKLNRSRLSDSYVCNSFSFPRRLLIQFGQSRCRDSDTHLVMASVRRGCHLKLIIFHSAGLSFLLWRDVTESTWWAFPRPNQVIGKGAESQCESQSPGW